jgi:Tfp pilus assembly protein PilN
VRPVNLLPPEERAHVRGEQGVLAYGIVGGLALVLLLVLFMVMTGNKIDDKNSELSALQAREQAAQAQAQALAPYAEFASLSQARDATVSSLAKSRFDWERVLRELALVLPENVWLTSVTGTVSPAVTVEGQAGNTLRGQAPGPALELIGCADGQETVAAFVAALKDIDGVTRVGLDSSELPVAGTTASGGDSAGGDSGDCRTKDFIAQFQIVVAFDAVPAPESTTAVPGTTTPAATGTTTAPQSTTTGESAVPGAADATAAEQQQKDSVAKQTGRAEQARNIIPGSGQ